MSLFASIWDDIRHTFRVGNMVTRLMVLNFGIFVLVNLIYLVLLLAQGPVDGSATLWAGLEWFCMPAFWRDLLYHPWAPFTHMFLHFDIRHVLFNLMGLYLFGAIVHDLIGNRRVLPLYILGGLFGGVVFIISAQFSYDVGAFALGASGAVMALAGAALILAPDYQVRLLFLGDTKVKYIVLVLLLLDMIGVANRFNSGGHIAHIGGFVMGCLFVYRLRDGHDWAEPVNRLFDWIGDLFSGASRPAPRPARKASKAYSSPLTASRGGRAPQDEPSYQERLDAILDKIKQNGYESLSAEEKEFLYNASKK